MPAEQTSPEMPVPFNFSRAGQIANEQLRTLRTLDEQYSRNLTHTLGAWLRTNITITPQSAEQMLFSQFMERTANGVYLLPLSLEPMQVRGAMTLNLSLAPPIIDLLLGGSGRVAAVPRELTEIEEAVLSSVLDIVLREWSSAWSSFGLEFVAGERHRGGHGQRLMLMQERVFCCRFQVSVADLSGELMFCLPSAAVTSTLRAASQRRDRQRERTPEERARMAQRMRGAGVHASLHFPAVSLSAESLRLLKPGALLPLPLQRGVSAELRVAGITVFKAQPVRSGDHRAAQIVGTPENMNDGGNAA